MKLDLIKPRSVVALIAAVCIAGVKLIGTGANTKFSSVSSSL